MKDKPREFIAVRFEIDLPLKRDQLIDAIGLLEGLTAIFRKAAERPTTVDARAPAPSGVAGGDRG